MLPALQIDKAPASTPRTNFLHIVCDDPYCTHALTLGISETVEEAIGRAHQMMSHEDRGQPISVSSGVALVADPPDTPEATALNAAAVRLGWRRIANPEGTRSVFCPDHAADLVCEQCNNHDCHCVAGPRFDAVRR